MPIFTYNLKQTDIMKDLLKFATEGNADQVFAILDDQHFENPILMGFKNRYEQGDLGDSGLCDEIIKYIEGIKPKKYAIITCIKEEWDEPNIDFVSALTEEEARSIWIEDGGDYLYNIDEGEEDGEIFVIIKEVV